MSRIRRSTSVAPLTTTIAQNATTSAAIDLENSILCGISLPAMTLTSATMTFLVSANGTDYVALLDEVGVAVGLSGLVESKDISLGNIISHMYGIRYIKLVMGTAQASARTITLRTRQAA